jgi:fluoroquinolone transport system permease protein
VSALARPTARAMTWGPLAAGTALGLAILAVPEALSHRLTAAHLTTLLRIAAACTAVGVAFLLDDPATRSISTVATPRLLRHAVRAALAVPALAAGWGAALLVAGLGTGTGVSAAVPRGALTLEAAALVAVALGLAALGLRFTDGSAGVLAAPTLMVVVGIVWFLPRRAALILAPGDPHWGAAHLRWAALLAVAAGLFLRASYEAPARRHRPAPVLPR